MKIKANDKFHGKNSGFVDLGFVKLCDELVLGIEPPLLEVMTPLPNPLMLKNIWKIIIRKMKT